MAINEQEVLAGAGGASDDSRSSTGSVTDGGAGQGGVPQNLQGKSPQEIIGEYTKLEKHLGELRNEVGKNRELNAQYQRFAQGWDPILRQFNYDPNA